tara:strand:- start:484 stop:639 length:156 start_codon:yes stop_codon:yes gene_type:complete
VCVLVQVTSSPTLKLKKRKGFKFGFAGAILIIVSFLSPFEILVTILDSDLF